MEQNLCSNCNQYSLYALPRTSVCALCGVEKIVPYDMYTQSKIIDWSGICIPTAYSRKKRFAKLFDSVVTGHAEKKDELMLSFLATRKNEIKTREDVLDCIRISSLPDKRYGSIHLFSRIYVPNFTAPLLPANFFQLKKRVLRKFEDFEFEHRNKYYGKPFFNYRWLLGKIMFEFGISQFAPFIKVIKCKKRRQHYEDMYQELSTAVQVK